MKLYLDGTLVVEGKEDASYLSNYIASEIVVVNGFETAEETISYLKNRKVLLLLDPDEAGLKIRSKLNEQLDGAINIEIDINKCTRGIKNGVAECQIDELLNKLRDYAINNPSNTSNLKISDLYNLGLSNNKGLRMKVCQKLNLGKCNVKTLYRRLNINGIDVEQLRKIIKE